MSDDVGGAWEQVGERISALGRSMRSRLSSGEEGGSSELRGALQRLGDAVKDLVDRADQAVRDPEVRDQAKDVGRTLDQALSRTFERAASEIDEAVGKLRARAGKGSGAAGSSATDAGAGSGTGSGTGSGSGSEGAGPADDEPGGSAAGWDAPRAEDEQGGGTTPGGGPAGG